jgi:hypothetical protein
MKIHIVVETSATAENLDDLDLREYLHLLMVGTMDHLWSSRVVSWEETPEIVQRDVVPVLQNG